MSCCSIQVKQKQICPICKEQANGVLEKTLNSLLKDDIKKTLNCLDGFSYCKTSLCKVIYLKNEYILTQNNVKVDVGLKDISSKKTVCYCFDWTKDKIQTQINLTNTCNALEDIKEKMNTIGCSCETLNPSGQCCLKDVKSVIEDIKNNL